MGGTRNVHVALRQFLNGMILQWSWLIAASSLHGSGVNEDSVFCFILKGSSQTKALTLRVDVVYPLRGRV